MTIVEYPDFDMSSKQDGKTILLLHGSGINRKMWIPQMAGIGDRYCCMAPDLPGHGSRREVKFSFDTAVEYLKDILENNDCPEALVVGLSLGGYVASEFAGRYPNRTNGLVLVGASTVPVGYASVPYHLLAFFYRFVSPRWLTQHDTRQWRLKYRAEIAEPVISAGFYHDVVPTIENEMAGRDFLARLESYTKPVLIVNGERDHIFRKDETLYRNTIRDSKLVVIKNAGHMCNLDAPEEFNSNLLAFAESIRWQI
jgi:pimeloyl-ACP methyl ester carboxylesterase